MPDRKPVGLFKRIGVVAAMLGRVVAGGGATASEATVPRPTPPVSGAPAKAETEDEARHKAWEEALREDLGHAELPPEKPEPVREAGPQKPPDPKTGPPPPPPAGPVETVTDSGGWSVSQDNAPTYETFADGHGTSEVTPPPPLESAAAGQAEEQSASAERVAEDQSASAERIAEDQSASAERVAEDQSASAAGQAEKQSASAERQQADVQPEPAPVSQADLEPDTQ